MGESTDTGSTASLTTRCPGSSVHCVTSQQSSESQRSYNRHLGAESKTKECEVCHKMFCPADIYKHMKTVHGKQENKFTCNQCGKSFPQLHKLKFHSSVHNN